MAPLPMRRSILQPPMTLPGVISPIEGAAVELVSRIVWSPGSAPSIALKPPDDALRAAIVREVGRGGAGGAATVSLGAGRGAPPTRDMKTESSSGSCACGMRAEGGRGGGAPDPGIVSGGLAPGSTFVIRELGRGGAAPAAGTRPLGVPGGCAPGLATLSEGLATRSDGLTTRS